MGIPLDALLALAKAQIGTKENPSNRVKYNTAYYGREVSGSAYPWCVTFVWWLFSELGASALFYGGGKTASSSALYRYHREQGQAVDDYRPGDVIYFLFGENGHTGICESFDGTYITTIDGNTGTDSEFSGGAVMRRRRHRQYIKGAWRPRYEEERTIRYKTLADIPAWGRETVEVLVDKGWLQGDETGALDLSEDMLRLLVINHRAGLYP